MRISTLIDRSSAHPASGPPPPSETRKKPDPVFGPSSPPPSYSPLPPQAEKKADTAVIGPSDDIAYTAIDTLAPTIDPPTDMVYLF